MISLFLFRVAVANGSGAQAFLLQHCPFAILSQNVGGKRSPGCDGDVGDDLFLVCHGSSSALYQDLRESGHRAGRSCLHVGMGVFPTVQEFASSRES